MKAKCGLIFVILYSFSALFTILAAETSLTILHTNDIHSHFLGFSPNKDYTPNRTEDDATKGGLARISTVIKSIKASRNNPVLVLDGGDFLMGSLFHMVSREHALELELMKEMEYDVITLGNHEFDLKPSGLERIVKSAAAKDKLPTIVASNLIFDPKNKNDDGLEAVFKNNLIKPYVVMQQSGLKIGFIGLMGMNAAEVAPFASPVKFDDIFITSKRMVKKLRDIEKVDLVICLSHSGLSDNPERSEDEHLAENVSGIDIIISGHSHSLIKEPIEKNNTIIVQAGDYGRYIGVLDVIFKEGKITFAGYKQIEINDTIKADDKITAIIESGKEIVNKNVLNTYGLSFDQTIVETDFDLLYKNHESNLGNLITDALRWAVDKVEYDPADPKSRVQVAVQSNGVIRDDILKGKTGLISVSDLFRAVPLGIGLDNTMTYPMLSFYVNGAEIKKTIEVMTTIYPLKGDDYFLQFSGIKITYNPNRMLFDRVTDIQLEDENGEFIPLDYSDENKELYKITSNFYNSTFLKIIGSFTNDILSIVPKDRDGNPIDDLSKHRVDGDKTKPGIQEIKEWTSLMGYVQTFEDKNGNGIADMPERYRSTDNRQIIQNSLNPYRLLKGGNYLTWIALAAIILALIILILIAYILVKIMRRVKTGR